MDDSKMITELRRMAEIKAMTFEIMSGMGMMPMETMLIERQPDLRERIEAMKKERDNAMQMEAGALAIVADRLEAGEPVENVLIKYVVKMAKDEKKSSENVEEIYEDDYEDEQEYDDAKYEAESEAESAAETAEFLRSVIRKARASQ